MIKATVICDSVSEAGNRITTFEIEVPRIVWSEFMTHRMFSRNAASSRAIPFDKMLQQLQGIPSRFGAANSGMQDSGEGFMGVILNSYEPKEAWDCAKEDAIFWSKAFKEAGYHKQVYNRLTEPFQVIKAVVTATEWNNFFWLRDDKMADPTLQELAGKMRVAYNESVPQLLKDGEWHLPYVQQDYFDICGNGLKQYFYKETDGSYSLGNYLTVEDAIKVSAARCAAVSYRNEDYGLEKCLQLYDRLVGDERKHASALEHQATPMKQSTNMIACGGSCYGWGTHAWEDGVSHMDASGNLWSGNFKNWIQHRKTLPDENYTGVK